MTKRDCKGDNMVCEKHKLCSTKPRDFFRAQAQSQKLDTTYDID